MSQTSPDRRAFLRAAGAAGVAALPALAAAATPAHPTPSSAAETAVKALYDSLTPAQRKAVCFGWDHADKARGLLRTHVSNNWQVTPHRIRSGFYTPKQQGIVYDIFKELYSPEWRERVERQLREDAGGKPWGAEQSIALFGEPGGPFEFVMTGRHQTIRADGNTEGKVAFGGPIFYGHAGKGFNEAKDHPGNVFWHQAVAANRVFSLLSETQRKAALLSESPDESAVALRGDQSIPGLAIRECSADVKAELGKVLASLLEPFRGEDRAEAMAALAARGGLDGCRLSFFGDEDVGEDGVWDNWRIEGPAFVWHYRGSPHVHVWVNVADSPDVKLNARG